MSDKTYNGWTNYETWLVKLWMDNSEGDSCYWQEEAIVTFRDCVPSKWNTQAQQARINLAETLKDRHEQACHEALPEDMHASFIMDLLNGALSEVNWHEISESLLTNHCEEYNKEPVAA